MPAPSIVSSTCSKLSRPLRCRWLSMMDASGPAPLPSHCGCGAPFGVAEVRRMGGVAAAPFAAGGRTSSCEVRRKEEVAPAPLREWPFASVR